MATNKVYGEGRSWKYTTTTDVVAGSLLMIGATPAVALESAATGVVIDVENDSEWLLPKLADSNTGWAAGERVYVIDDDGVNKLTGLAAATGAPGTLIGFGTVAAATGDTTGQVKLIGGPSPLESQG